ncbi:MAG: hypothetical protein PHY48_13355 [Candidatus Cloacimonetes bacterium]|nr:hypothetical protein [Candidatus Cloacimonadota bacterium]
MKIKEIGLIGVVSVIVSVLFVIIVLFGFILKINSASTGLTHSYLKTAGKAIARGFRESNTFPRDGGADDKNHQAEQSNQWHVLSDVEQMLSKSGRIINNDIPKSYFDADIWTVVKNIPYDPPSNLIVLASRNVDPSSLRTRLADEDMQKHIRFRGENNDLWILKKIAVLICADGMSISVPVVSPTSRRANRTTYRHIYRSQPFDLTTNLVNGLQVKYLTSDGEAIPTND